MTKNELINHIAEIINQGHVDGMPEREVGIIKRILYIKTVEELASELSANLHLATLPNTQEEVIQLLRDRAVSIMQEQESQNNVRFPLRAVLYSMIEDKRLLWDKYLAKWFVLLFAKSDLEDTPIFEDISLLNKYPWSPSILRETINLSLVSIGVDISQPLGDYDNVEELLDNAPYDDFCQLYNTLAEFNDRDRAKNLEGDEFPSVGLVTPYWRLHIFLAFWTALDKEDPLLGNNLLYNIVRDVDTLSEEILESIRDNEDEEDVIEYIEHYDFCCENIEQVVGIAIDRYRGKVRVKYERPVRMYIGEYLNNLTP